MSSIKTPADIASAIAAFQNAKTVFERQVILFDLEANMFRALNFDGALQNGDPERHVLALEQYIYLITVALNLFKRVDNDVFCEEIVLDAAFKCCMNIFHIMEPFIRLQIYKRFSENQTTRLKYSMNQLLDHLGNLNSLAKSGKFTCNVHNDRTGSMFLAREPNEIALQYHQSFMVLEAFVLNAYLNNMGMGIYNDTILLQFKINLCLDCLDEIDDENLKFKTFARCLMMGRQISAEHLTLLKLCKDTTLNIVPYDQHLHPTLDHAIDNLEELERIVEKWQKEGKYPDYLNPNEPTFPGMSAWSIAKAVIAILIILALAGLAIWAETQKLQSGSGRSRVRTTYRTTYRRYY